jgi:hypothetical protein
VKQYLVQIQYRTDAGRVHLTSFTVRAGANTHAYEMVSKLTCGTGDIIGGYVTCDPYKIEQWGKRRQAAY